MNNPAPSHRAGPSAEEVRAWEATRARIERGLEQHFPGIVAGYGEYTGNWFAFDRRGPMLTAATPEQLAEQIRRARQPHPPVPYQAHPSANHQQGRQW
ncbi:hypothetical protein Acsp04_61040 [Actinomadura sp. NBRC 104425]|uniref:hypothetical protein n=1 Tax=Actinomadura sp. NBRC 104425 TaxID=3032204 RepID=UPI0024A1C635|nr:hypothetical protein [Actinomadura sp. NBRC 104425]GLZ15869.1 hypothetical protein Acsp04_61040 [Actinomadura sp. NBRC 104425]